MTERICSIDDCERTVRCKNLCGLHYDRVRRWGSPHLPPERRCELSDCERKHYARGYCKAHYKRLHATGDPQADRPLRDLPTAEQRLDVEARILAKCHVYPGGCIEWHGMKNAAGYGAIGWQGRSWSVHRAMWTAKVGPIPTDDDWTVDHLCSNRACVNIEHLEIVTRTENARRGGGLDVANWIRRVRIAQQTHCKRGHERALYSHRTPGGTLYCSECRREKHLEAKARARPAAA